MAFQNEEDYLDNLLKSMTDNEKTDSDGELFPADPDVQIPETFETPDIEDEHSGDFANEDPYVLQTDEENNPFASLFGNDAAEPWNDVKDEDISEDASFNNSVDEEFNILPDNNSNESISEPTEDDLVDDYIKKLLSAGDETDNSDSEPVDSTIADNMAGIEENTDKNPEEDIMKYDAGEDNDDMQDNDLLSRLDGILNDVEEENPEEVLYPDQDAQAEVAATKEDVDYSDFQVDDDLKELLGIENPEDLADIQSFGEQLSVEELEKLADIDTQGDLSEDNIFAVGGMSEPESNDYADNMDVLQAETADAGIDADTEETQIQADGAADENNDGNSPVSDNNLPEENKKERKSILKKFLGVFKKKNDEETVNDASNENQKVLESLFDENGELLNDDKKVKKKGLFSKRKETPIEESPDSDMEIPLPDIALADVAELDVSSEDRKKEKKKKEKKKKEPKEKKVKQKKPKKEKKPKVKREKVPVNPSELIHIKPIVIIIMVVVTVVITGYVYFFITSFSYNHAVDNATYYMLEKKYTFAYEAIAGVETKKEEDVALKDQISTIMYVQKQYNSYENYMKMNMPFEALDSLIKGIQQYDLNYNAAAELGVSADLDNVKLLIVNALQQYGITESMARSYGAITDYEQYVYILESYGGISNDSNN